MALTSWRCHGADNVSYVLHEAESVSFLPSLPANHFDAVITDPPYSSGGTSLAEKAAAPEEKYGGEPFKRFATFGGDSRDQRSYLAWCSLWMGECFRVLRPGGYFLCFTDWRQLPTITDAVQCAGFVWRGVVVWDKGRGARAPHKGYFRHQCEFVVWATKGRTDKPTHDGPYEGCISVPVIASQKHHMTGKPLRLMEHLVRPVAPGGVILDPFAGSAMTGVAALRTGRSFVGIERERAHVLTGRKLLRAASGKTATL